MRSALYKYIYIYPTFIILNIYIFMLAFWVRVRGFRQASDRHTHTFICYIVRLLRNVGPLGFGTIGLWEHRHAPVILCAVITLCAGISLCTEVPVRVFFYLGG